MDTIQKKSTINSYRALIRRELGLSSHCLGSLFAQRVRTNITQDRYTKAIYKKNQLFYGQQIHYPSIVTIGKKALKLWSLETGKCQWSTPIASTAYCYGVELLEDRVVCIGERLSYSGLGLWIFRRDTGERIAQYLHPKLSKGNYLCGKQRDFFVAGEKQIERRSLDSGEVIQKIDLEEEFIDPWALVGGVRQFPSRFPSRLASSKDILVHLFEGGLAAYSLNRKENYQIEFNFKERRLTHLFFEGGRCFCATRQENILEEEGCFLDFHLFDLEKKNVTHLYQIESDNAIGPQQIPAGMVATVYKQWAYLGCTSGHLVAVNWVNGTSMVLCPNSPEPINFLSLQEDLLITGSYSQNFNELGTLKFWNIHSLTQIGQIDWPLPCAFPVLSFGKLVLVKGSSFVVRDYSGTIEKDNASS